MLFSRVNQGLIFIKTPQQKAQTHVFVEQETPFSGDSRPVIVEIAYDREDASTFRDVDVVSGTTGQKVRQSRFVEQEQFTYVLDIFFIEGATGDLRHRDRMQRGLVFQGTSNDPIDAFYTLSQSISTDVLSVVTLRYREESRAIFKR